MKKPNIIVMYSDQLRRSALSCYGDPNVRTPHIDKLAGEGVRFNSAYSVYPVCVPARFAMWTGKYPHTRLVPNIEWRMSPCERTIAHEMNDNGYDTCYIGKWHLYGGYDKGGDLAVRKHVATTYIPPDYRGGFRHWQAYEFRNNHFDTYYQDNNDRQFKPVTGYQADGLFDLTISFLEKEKNNPKPLFTVLSFEAPHPPFEVPETYAKRYKNRELVLQPNMQLTNCAESDILYDEQKVLGQLKTYYAMIENIDDNVGKLMAYLEKSGLKDNTIVILTSDHGEMMGCHGLKGKANAYEESAGVPLIIAGPGIKPLEVNDPVTTLDMFPTFQDLAGIPLSPNPGLSLLPAMQGKDVLAKRKGILLEHVSYMLAIGVFSPSNWRALRTSGYKYVAKGAPHNAKPYAFFDMEKDPYEMHNLLHDPAYKALVKEHHEELKKMIMDTDDDYIIADL